MRKKTNFDESLAFNNFTYLNYLDRLYSIAISSFEWLNLPDTVDQRYLELTLTKNGSAVFFKDEVLSEYYALSVLLGGNFDVYGNPLKRTAFSNYNAYRKNLNEFDSVIIYNNYLRNTQNIDLEMFAKRLYDIDRTIDVNARAQKTPLLIEADEKQKMTMLNLYKEYDGNAPVVFGRKGTDLTGSIKAITTNAPYVSDKLYELKTQIWNEALTMLGISNVSYQKRERMVTDEVNRTQGGVIANRLSRLNARKDACKKINNMFGLNIDVVFKDVDAESEVLENE